MTSPDRPLELELATPRPGREAATPSPSPKRASDQSARTKAQLPKGRVRAADKDNAERQSRQVKQTTRVREDRPPMTHVVAAGESLWSIARAQLGSDASISDLAAQVESLWAVNAKRIRSGDPDLIDIGERLTLPSEAN